MRKNHPLFFYPWQSCLIFQREAKVIFRSLLNQPVDSNRVNKAGEHTHLDTVEFKKCFI